MITPSQQALLTLTLASGLGPVRIRRALEVFGSCDAVLGATAQSLTRVQGIGPKQARTIRQSLDEIVAGDALQREMDMIAAHDVTLLSFDDPDYPPLLKHIADAPALLYVQGELRSEDALALGIVGSRRCSAYGRSQADRFAALAAQAGMTIVSGGAFGIDAAAHEAAVRINGRTIAVIGSGLAKPYPPKNKALFERIVAGGHGAVISELPMTTPPAPENFPARNRIISGLSLGILVVEAAVRSGALITARLAAEEHAREVMVLPGRVDSPTSAGCHKIIREGWATLVTNMPELFEALGDTGTQLAKLAVTREADMSPASEPNLFERNLSESQQRIVHVLEHEMYFDQLVERTSLPAATIQADLTMLQIRGLIARSDGKFHRTQHHRTTEQA